MKQRGKGDAGFRFRNADDRQIGTVLVQQRDGIGMKTGDDIEFDFRPSRTEYIHGGHEPVETGMAFHCDSQCTGRTVFQADQVALRIFDGRYDGVGQFQETLSDDGKSYWHAFSLEKQTVIGFQQANLLRYGRLRQMKHVGRPCQVARFAQCPEGFQMFQFYH